MNLTSGALLLILRNYCSCHGKQSEIYQALNNSVLGTDDIHDVRSHSDSSGVVSGRREIPVLVQDALKSLDYNVLKDRLEKKVVGLLKNECLKSVIAAFKIIFSENKNLDEKIILGKSTYLTKNYFLNRMDFNFADVLTSAVFYAGLEKNKENPKELSKLNDSFFKRCDKLARRLSLVSCSVSIPEYICEAPQIKKDYKCQKCGKPSVSTVSVNGIPISLCEGCKNHVLDLDSDGRNEFLKTLKQDFDNQKFMDDFPTIVSDEEIEYVLKKINSLGALDEVQLSIRAVEVSEKVGDGFLCRTIQNSNSINYRAINGVLSRFDIKNETRSNRFRDQIRSMFLNLVAVSPDMAKDEMIEKLVDALCEHSDVRYRNAARALIYYSIQSCEVFHAPSK